MTVIVQDRDINAALAELKERMRREKVLIEYIEHTHPNQRGAKPKGKGNGGRKK